MKGLRWLMDRPGAPASRTTKIVIAGGMFLLLTGICWGVLAGSTRNWEAVWKYRQAFLHGWLLTIGVSSAALVLSTLIGLGVALGRRSSFLPLRYLLASYVELVRGMPLLVLIFWMWYVLANRIHWEDRLAVGVLTLSLFAGAYISEMIRAGIDGVGRTQWESAKAICLTNFQTYRYVIFPQALRQTLAPLAGQFASLIKDSSLLSVIAISEFTFMAGQINSATFSTLESYLPLGFGYLILTLPISLISKYLERKYHYES